MRASGDVPFAWYRKLGEFMGLRKVVAGSLVRSSYHAEHVWTHAVTGGAAFEAPSQHPPPVEG